MNVSELFDRAEPQKVIDAYTLMDPKLYGMPVRQRINALHAAQTAIRHNIRLLGSYRQEQPADACSTLFVLERDVEAWPPTGQKRVECFSVHDEEVEETLQTNPSLSCRDDAGPISFYSIYSESVDKLSVYRMAEACVSEYGIDICCAAILQSLFSYGYTSKERDEAIAERQEQAERTLKAIENDDGDVSEDDAFQNVLNACKSEDERVYLMAHHDFRRSVRDVETSHLWAMHCENMDRKLAMVRDEFMVRRMED